MPPQSRERRRSRTRRDTEEPRVKPEEQTQTFNLYKEANNAIRQLSTQQQAFTTAVTDFFKAQETNQKAYLTALNANTSATPYRREGQADRLTNCSFCGLPSHYMRECEVLQEYLRLKKVKKDPESNKLVTPTGGPIPSGGRNECLKQRLDHWHAKVKSLFTQVEDFEGSNDLLESMIVEISPVCETVDSPAIVASYTEAEKEREQLVAAIRSGKPTHPRQTRGKPASQSEPRPFPAQPVQPAEPKPVASTPVNAESPSIAPRFQNKSKAEDQELIDQLMKMILDGRLTEITPSHILASSPVIRTHLINYLRNQRVEVNHLTQTFEAGSPNKRIVAADSLPLGEIEVLINQQIPVRGVIDNGSQIVTIREDLWKELLAVEME